MRIENDNPKAGTIGIITDPNVTERVIEKERGIPAQRKRGESRPRPRAASYGGRVEPTMNIQRVRQEGAVGGVGTDKPPKPQRPPTKRNERRTQKAAEDKSFKPSENPLRSWLSNARKGGRDEAEPPIASNEEKTVPISPSWADADDSTDDDDGDYSDQSGTPTQSTVNLDDSLTPMKPPTTGRHLDGIISPDVDDVYALPPSGQVTERKQQLRNAAPRQRAANDNYGGARPKNRGKGTQRENEGGDVDKTRSRVSEKTRNDKGKNEQKTYANVAAANRWEQVKKKRKFDRVSPKSARPLKGIAATTNRDIYLQGLVIDTNESEEDVIESVRIYCLDRGITPVYICIIPVKFDCTRTGCRLTVRDEDYDRVIENEFWPENISARDWTPRPRGNAGGGQRQQSDNED